jgi:hypothetical protein
VSITHFPTRRAKTKEILLKKLKLPPSKNNSDTIERSEKGECSYYIVQGHHKKEFPKCIGETKNGQLKQMQIYVAKRQVYLENHHLQITNLNSYNAIPIEEKSLLVITASMI